MSPTPSVLVVDDDTAHRTMLRALVSGWGYDIAEANDGSVAIEKVKEGPYDLVLMDIRMLKVSGLEAMEQIKAFNPAIPVIIMTAYSSVETAVAALKNGAYDYLTKPLDFDKLRLTMARAVEHIRLKEENKRLKEHLGQRFDRQNIVGNSPALAGLLETVSQVAPSEATVLITGESGTGKELIAGALHYNSARQEGPFIKINCAAITETLFESELFGHERGAFTGADRQKDGRFLLANGGTLFLDEISEMPPAMQVKLLRVIQEREITRVGGEQVIPVDVRIIAATNKDLVEAIAHNKFREDLYYRLNVVQLEVPPLRKRREDIPLLVQFFMDQFSEKNRKDIQGITPGAMDRMLRYDWPGNVRELMNAVERGVVMARTSFLEETDIPTILPPDSAGHPQPSSEPAFTGLPLEQVEKTAILQTLSAAGGNKSEAARQLGITRKTLHKKLKSYGMM